MSGVQTGKGRLRGGDQTGRYNLTGKGVLTAIIDTGIDYLHPDFRNPDGTTRIVELWDQDLERVFSSEDINEAIAAAGRRKGKREQEKLWFHFQDSSGHGTAVAGICAGNERPETEGTRGVAYKAVFWLLSWELRKERAFPGQRN